MARETQAGSSHRRLLPAFLLAAPASPPFLLAGGDARARTREEQRRMVDSVR